MRLKIKNNEKLKEHLKGDFSCDFKALVLKLVTKFQNVQKVSEITDLPTSTIYQWIKDWNESEKLCNNRGEGGGRKSKLRESEKQELFRQLKEKEYWTTKQVKILIKEKFGVDYSLEQVRRTLRSFGMIFSKPYPKDSRRPKDADKILGLKVREAFKEVNISEAVIGFIDETSPSNTANTQRVWSFVKPISIKNTERFKLNTIGFYAIGGNSVLDFLPSSKEEQICGFLNKIRRVNGDKPIVAILDNFRSHKGKKVIELAKELGIRLIYLPPYSPDLNPIEQVWRVIKRTLSVVFVENILHLKEVVEKSYYENVRSLSFCRNWIRRFLNPI